MLRGDYEELYPDELGKWSWRDVVPPARYAVAAVAAVALACVVFGGDPVETAVADLKAEKAVRAALAGPPAAAPARRIVGWWVPFSDGSVRFVPAAPTTMPAPGGPADRPFVPTPATTPATPAPSAAAPSITWRAPARGPAPTPTPVPPAIRGGTATGDCPT